ncbi:MAG: hypothetical protein WD794_09200 [Mycobacteriales bacterium]
MSLRDLDTRLVPRLAVLLRGVLDGLSDRRRRLSLVMLAGGRALRRLDDRYVARGPLRLLSDVPQLGLFLAATVFVAGTGAALALSSPETVREREQAQREAELPLTLGPPVGADIDAHFATARDRAVELSRRDPGGRFLALISLNRGLTPEETGELLVESGLEVRLGYLRAPVPGEPEKIRFQTPGEIVAGLRQVFSQIAMRKADEQQELLRTAKTIAVGSPEEEFRRVYEADARTVGQEANAYRTGCACVFALVVEAQAAELAELPALPVVRGVELARRGAELDMLRIFPVAPSEQGVVEPPVQRGSQSP